MTISKKYKNRITTNIKLLESSFASPVEAKPPAEQEVKLEKNNISNISGSAIGKERSYKKLSAIGKARAKPLIDTSKLLTQ